MPVKAKAPQYVKICTLYGTATTIPGTDTCIKLGGYVRLDVVWDADGGRLRPTIQVQPARRIARSES